MVSRTDIKKLESDELMEVVELYPWFGAAQKELCMRMSGQWGEDDFASAALHIASRRVIFEIARDRKKTELSDKEVSTLLQTYGTTQRKSRAVGGDFFSQEAYDQVRKDDDKIFSSFAAKVSSEREISSDLGILDDFCTEPIAEIYAEQGYFEQAKYIYSKLILRYPEKNSYFAALIDKLDNCIDN